MNLTKPYVTTYVPHYAPGEVYMCNFGPDPAKVRQSSGGVLQGPLAVPPEIFKDRHVVVLSPRKRNRRVHTAVVVPFSTKRPQNVEAVHVTIPAGRYAFLDPVEQWIKTDLIETVSLSRLTPALLNGVPARAWINAADLKAIQQAVLHALSLGQLAPHV